jgi:hypothetical protein
MSARSARWLGLEASRPSESVEQPCQGFAREGADGDDRGDDGDQYDDREPRPMAGDHEEASEEDAGDALTLDVVLVDEDARERTGGPTPRRGPRERPAARDDRTGRTRTEGGRHPPGLSRECSRGQ